MSDQQQPSSPSKTDFERIKPASFDQAGSQTPKHTRNKPAASKSKAPAIILLLSLAALLLFTTMVVPKLVSPPASQASTKTSAPPTNASANPTAPVATATPEASPYTEAQLAKQRKEAQAALEKLLEQQNTLEQMSVELWADAEYKKAAELAVVGDASYRKRQFKQASTDYIEANTILAGVLERKDELLQKLITDGENALKLGSKAQAVEAFTLVSNIDPENTTAINGLKRAETIDQVFALMTQATNQQQDNQLDSAVDTYQQVLAIDPLAQDANTSIASIKQQQREAEFSGLMSKGLAAIDRGNARGARDYFNKAGKIKPNDKGVKDGLRQTSQMLSSARINTTLSEVAVHEQQEDWGKAAELLDSAIAKEGQLSGFAERRDTATRRLQLNQRLENIIKKPELLADDNVHKAAKEILTQANGVNQPGPKLRNQIAQVDQLLRDSLVPVNIVIESDNLTEVNVFKIARLGRIASKSLTLRPGKYVITGARNGYRDVRQEIIIKASDAGKRIRIACTELI